METLLYIPFLVSLFVCIFLYLAGKKKYVAYIDALDKKEYNLKDFFPIGLYLMELSRYNYNSDSDRLLRRQLTELYTADYADFYLRIIWAQALTGAMLGVVMGGLFLAATASALYFAMGLALAGVLFWASFNTVKQKVDERHMQITMDLPELTNQLLILSGAGMTLKGALIKISKEMPATGPLYQALEKATEKMEHGETDEQSFDGLIADCNTPEIRRFASVMLQNINRGGNDVLLALREMGKELWDSRRSAAIQIAEGTSTKLLFPMMFMLLAVILLVAAPAVMSLSGI